MIIHNQTYYISHLFEQTKKNKLKTNTKHMNKQLHDKYFFNCPWWKGIWIKIEGFEKNDMQFEMHLVNPGPLWLQFLKVWSGFEKKTIGGKKNKKKWNLMKFDEIWWNLMKSWFHQISSNFIFPSIFFPSNIFFQSQIHVKPKYNGTHVNNKITPNYWKINFKSAGWWTLET